MNLTGADTVIFVEHDWNPMKDLQVRNQQPFEPVPSPLYIPIFTNFAQALFLVDAVSCLFLIASIIFLSHGPSSSYWTEEGCKRVQIDYTGNTRGKDYGVGFKAALFESYSTLPVYSDFHQLCSSFVFGRCGQLPFLDCFDHFSKPWTELIVLDRRRL